MALSISGVRINGSLTAVHIPPPTPAPTYYLWAWGYNTSGELGLGNTTNRSSPVQVGALTTWLSIAAGDYYSMAIKTDGTMWSWGGNDAGRLGLGDTTNQSSPVQVGSLTNWYSVAGGVDHSLAISN